MAIQLAIIAAEKCCFLNPIIALRVVSTQQLYLSCYLENFLTILPAPGMNKRQEEVMKQYKTFVLFHSHVTSECPCNMGVSMHQS
jgi:hypothetical protein